MDCIQVRTCGLLNNFGALLLPLQLILCNHVRDYQSLGFILLLHINIYIHLLILLGLILRLLLGLGHDGLDGEVGAAGAPGRHDQAAQHVGHWRH